MAGSQDWQAMLSEEQRAALDRVRSALFVPAEERSHFERQELAAPAPTEVERGS